MATSIEGSESSPSFPVRRTLTIDEFNARINWGGDPHQSWESRFDNCPIIEIREECLRQMAHETSTRPSCIDWFIHRINAYLDYGDVPTALMLLRHVGVHYQNGSRNADVVRLMAAACTYCLEKEPYYAKDAFVILCGKLDNHPELWQYGRDAIARLMTKLWPLSTYGSDENESRLVLRALYIIGRCRAAEFLPLLKSAEMSQKEREHLVTYTSVAKDRLAAEGYRLFLIRYFEGS